MAGAVAERPEAPEGCTASASAASQATAKGFKPIQRVKFTNVEELLALMKPHAEDGVPLVIEGSRIMDVDKWAGLSYLDGLLKDKTVLVKRSPNSKFRYFDLQKNIGRFEFRQPVEETRQTFGEFLAESERITREGLPQRLYLQETLSGHAEMAEEFAQWRWELLIKASSFFGWGLPDSNELFIGMEGAETPLHFDERENLFFHVRGKKELIVFPFVQYTRLYPFPTTHPCDRQSMVGSPFEADLDAFPRFREADGYHVVLEAGDLVYLPYGWWHWLRNLEDLSVSVSFWSTTPGNDFSKGVPLVFTDHMLTRVRRNLESMVAHFKGPERHNESMLQLRDAVMQHDEQDEILQHVRKLLAAVQMPPDKQDRFLLEIIEGRFDIDWNRYV